MEITPELEERLDQVMIRESLKVLDELNSQEREADDGKRIAHVAMGYVERVPLILKAIEGHLMPPDREIVDLKLLYDIFFNGECLFNILGFYFFPILKEMKAANNPKLVNVLNSLIDVTEESYLKSVVKKIENVRAEDIPDISLQTKSAKKTIPPILSSWSSVYQGKPTHALQRGVNKRVLAKAKTDRYGKGEIDLDGTKIFIATFDDTKKKLRPSAVKLFYAGIRELANKNPYKRTPEERIQYSVSFSLDNYMQLRDLSDRREARRQVKTDCEALTQLSAKWEERQGKNIKSFEIVNYFGGAKLENGIITLTFNPELAKYLVNKAFEMKLHNLYFKLNDKLNPYSATMLEYLTTRKRQTRGRGGEDVYSIKSLAAYISLPIEDRKFTEKVLTPFERDLDALDSALTWEYCKAKGLPLTDEENDTFSPDVFRESCIKIKWRDYPLSEYEKATKEVETKRKAAINRTKKRSL